MKRKLISFADSRLLGALKRVARQAEELKFFDEVETFTEKELGTDFRNAFSHILKRGVRGFGYWIWKPYIIAKELEKIEEGDELYYIDAGCHLNPHGRDRLIEYAELLKKNALGIAAFQLDSYCSERRFTKMDVLKMMGVEKDEKIIDSGQMCATHVFVVKRESSVSFVREWLKLSMTISHIDDSSSKCSNFPEFIEHRHDQSIFSILCKLKGAAAFPGIETWPIDGKNWSLLIDFPIWDKRDLGITSHLVERLKRKLHKKWLALIEKYR